jgi:group I intron endonuclease
MKIIDGKIYKITNLINNKCYIGQTVQDVFVRFQDHILNSKKEKPKYLIAKAIKKYGKENFKIEQIDMANTQKELNLLEGVYISWFKSMYNQNGYNIKNIIDGKGKHSQETKDKISKKHRGISGKKSSSKYCGVHFYQNKWRAIYYYNNKINHLGSFLIEEDAAKAHDIAEIKINPEAVLNFPELREQYLKKEIIITKHNRKKSNSNIIGVSFCNTRKKWLFYKKNIKKRFNNKEEAENFARNYYVNIKR